MKNEDEIKEILSAVATLLEGTGEASWSQRFRHLRNAFEMDSKEATIKIRALFGGMGSFNDLVLQQNGRLLFEENEILSNHRKRLFTLIHE